MIRDFFRAAVIVVAFLFIQAEVRDQDESQFSTHSKD